MSPKHEEIKQCKGCNAEIIWAFTKEGKRTPLDAKPVRIALLADTAGDLPRIEDGVTGHVSHWVTCSGREKFKGNYKI